METDVEGETTCKGDVVIESEDFPRISGLIEID